MVVFSKILRFIKNWALPFSMATGVASYLLLRAMSLGPSLRIGLYETATVLQPMLLFCMLFIAFCKVSPHDIRFRKSHVLFLMLQSGVFGALTLLLYLMRWTGENQILVECAMLSLICPTATAAMVITDKLKGDASYVVSYTLVINFAVSILVPLFVPLFNPVSGLSFTQAFLRMLVRIFPLLIFPMLSAWLIRKYKPRYLHYIYQVPDLAFYFWLVSLAIAMAITTRALVHAHISIACFVWMLIITLVACVLQFYVGRKWGGREGSQAYSISGGQSLGQKNTALMIWMGYSFMNPVTAVAGGMYSIWHNTINSMQLAHQRKAESSQN